MITNEPTLDDVDFCLRLRESGYRNCFTPFARVRQHESASCRMDGRAAESAHFKKEQKNFFERWQALIDNDPGYNPGAELRQLNFCVSDPPRQTLSH